MFLHISHFPKYASSPPNNRGCLYYHHTPLSSWRQAGTVLVSSPRLWYIMASWSPPSLINVLHNLFVFRYRHKGQLPLTLFRQKYRLGSLHLGGYGRRAPRLARSRECFRCKVTHFSGTPCLRHGKICRKFKLIVPHAQTSGIMSYICTRFSRAMSREL